jgi:hypothetical protein
LQIWRHGLFREPFHLVLPVFHLVIGHAFVHILAAEFEPAIDQPCQLLARAVIALGTPSRARRRRRLAPKALWLRSRLWSARRKALAARLTTLRVPRFIILSCRSPKSHQDETIDFFQLSALTLDVMLASPGSLLRLEASAVG